MSGSFGTPWLLDRKSPKDRVVGSPSKLGYITPRVPWVDGIWVFPEARTLDSLEDFVRQMRVPRGKVGFVCLS